jgi:hypothetical protein
MERGKNSEVRGAVSFYTQASCSSSNQLVDTVQYMIFKATKKLGHIYFPFLKLTILLKALKYP